MASVTPQPTGPIPVTTFRIPPDLKAASKSRAQSEGRTLTSVVVEKLEEYVEQTEEDA